MTYYLLIPDWHPTLDNRLVGRNRFAAQRLKTADALMVLRYAQANQLPPATGKRRVEITMTGWRRGRLPDPTAPLKSLLDALVHAKMLVDDSGKWAEVPPPRFFRDPRKETLIALTDLA